MVGKKIALLIGVSDYQNENNLPPCQKDIELMHAIVAGSEKYDDVLLLDNSPKSSEAKEKISSFIRKNQSQNIEEVFVYYTGHGARNVDDFLYLFSDFSNSRAEQTSLRNSEFDSMIKSLKPSLTVKVVDACQAGTEYIKSNQDLQVIFEKSSESFNKTYFLFSSSNSESSVALQDFSVFTKSLAKSLLDFKGQEIRYRDIMAYISDDKNVKRHQTPLFIQQADNTEIFCSVSPDLSDLIFEKLSSHDVGGNDDKNTEEPEETDTKPELTNEEILILAIRDKGKDFCSEEEAQKSLQLLVGKLTGYKWPSLIDELFHVESTEQQHTVVLDSKKGLAKWIKDNEEPYFVRITYDEEEYKAKEKVEYEDSPPRAYATFFGKHKRVEYQPVTRYREVVSGYELTAPSPSQTVMFALAPKYEVLPWFKVFFTYIFSKSKLTLFYKRGFKSEVHHSLSCNRSPMFVH